MKRPPPRFDGSAWRGDPLLRLCSLEARGLWADLCAWMQECETYGHLSVEGAPPSTEEIAAQVGRPVEEVARALAELERRRVPSRTAEGVLFSRRMAREGDLRGRRAAGGPAAALNPGASVLGNAGDGGRRKGFSPPAVIPKNPLPMPEARFVGQVVCPDCHRVTVVRQQPHYGTGWVCSRRRSGCGAIFSVREVRILDQLPAHQQEAVARGLRRLEGREEPPPRGNGPAAPAGPPRADPDPQAIALWETICAQVQPLINRHSYATWFRPLHGYALAGDVLTVEVPNPQFLDWLQRNYAEPIRAAAAAAGQGHVRISWEVEH